MSRKMEFYQILSIFPISQVVWHIKVNKTKITDRKIKEMYCAEIENFRIEKSILILEEKENRKKKNLGDTMYNEYFCKYVCDLLIFY